jgi:hypothetical protein
MTVIAMTQEMATLGTDVAQGIAQALGLKIVQHETFEAFDVIRVCREQPWENGSRLGNFSER